MFEIHQKVNKKDFFKCNAYYLRKFFGIKEVVMLSLLLLTGLILLLGYGRIFMLVMFVVVCVAILLALAFYLVTVFKGWQLEFEKPKVVEQILTFKGEILTIKTLNDNGETVFEDEFDIATSDKVALLKGKIYYYQGVATMFYIYPNDFEKGNYEDFREMLATTLPLKKFKMKTRKKLYQSSLQERNNQSK